MIAYLPPALFISAAAFTTWSLVATLRGAWPAIVETMIAGLALEREDAQ